METTNAISFLVPTLGKRHNEMRRLFDSLASQSFTSFEVVVVVQDYFDAVNAICREYKDMIQIKIIPCDRKGLSMARNKGLPFCNGDIVVLSDDDCWYPYDAAANIYSWFQTKNVDVALSKIFDLENGEEYKQYENKTRLITSDFLLLSKSSIEIAFRKKKCEENFDELFGLGSHFVCCEEVDFLIRNYRKKTTIMYFPTVTVYHKKKHQKSNRDQLVAKGALYAKDFNYFIGLLICIKDFLLRHEMNYSPFFEGFYEYRKLVM